MKKLISQDDNVFIYGTEKGLYKITIENDTDCESPRAWYTLGAIVAFGRSKYISDKNQNIWDDPTEFIECHPTKEWIILPLYKYEHSGVAYNTTGFNCRWDSGQVGFIYCSKEVAINEFGKKICTAKVREKAIEYMKGEVETFSNWANGQCYGYNIEFADWKTAFETTANLDGFDICCEIVSGWDVERWGDVDFVEIDSCWGYIEEDTRYEEMYCLSEAESNIE